MSGSKSTTRGALGKKATTQTAKETDEDISPHNANSSHTTAASLTKVLEEIREFRKDMKEQLHDIKAEITKVEHKVEVVEDRVGKIEDRTQNVETVLGKLIKEVARLEKKVLDQDGRSRRNNIRIYNVPEDAEGPSMTHFLEGLLQDKLDISITAADIERAHRALMPKPSGENKDKPRSIVMCLARSKIKDEIISKAWGMKKVLLDDNTQIFFDNDYHPTILQRRKDYTEAKRVLKQHGIRFQTPAPAKFRVHYQDGTQLYQSAEEATTDMKNRGLPIEIFKPAPKGGKEDLYTQLSRTAWESTKPRGRGAAAARGDEDDSA